MATTQIPESVTRDYIDNFSIKEMSQNELVPKYFEGFDVSNLNVGLLGYTTELIADGLEDTFNSVSTLHEEMFSNRAKFPSSILSHAAIFQLSNGMATAATCDFILIMNESYVIKNFQNENGTLSFYIDKDTKILVEDIIFTLDYDIVIRGIKREVANGYIYSAQYVVDEFNNSISNITTPYININKSANGMLTLKVTCHQCQRVTQYESIVNNTKINLPSFDISFENQLAGFDVFYKSSTDSGYNTQLTKLTKYSSPLKTPFCYYSFTDEQVLTILFGNRDSYFQPDFNSEIEVVMYITNGKDGNFETYDGKDISVVTTSERYPYNDNFFLVAQTLSASSGGMNTRTLEELQALTVEGYRTATVYATDNDLMEYFNNYEYRYGNECLFIKKRDDVVDRLYSGFIIMKKDDYIYPTNTLYLDTNLDEMANTEINKYILDPGCLFTYNDQGNAVILSDTAKEEEHREAYEQYLTDHELTDDKYSFWQYLSDNDINTKYTMFDTDKLEELRSTTDFLYTNPFLISVTKSPNLVGLYLTVINQTSAVDFLDQNLDVFDQFIITRLTVNRELEQERKYRLETALMPSATLSVDEKVISVYGDSSRNAENLIRVVATFEDSDGRNLCFTELTPIEKTTDGTYLFEGFVYTDDHVTTSGKFRLTDNIVYMDTLEDMLIPMSTVVNIYVLFRGNGIPNDNIFQQYQDDFYGYSWTNIYSTDNDPITFIKPMNMIKCELTYKDPQLEGNQSGDCQISSVPLIGVECMDDEDRWDYFITTFNDQYRNLEKTVDYLQTSTHIDLKFYNTYGRSKNFIIGDEVDGESLIDTINIKIKYYVWVMPNTDQLKAETDLKQFIKDSIEAINTDGTNSFYNSNMMRTIENNFAYVHHIKFIGINHYDPKYQTVKNVTVDLNTLTKEERIRYVPEILVANLDNIELTFFEA